MRKCSLCGRFIGEYTDTYSSTEGHILCDKCYDSDKVYTCPHCDEIVCPLDSVYSDGVCLVCKELDS